LLASSIAALLCAVSPASAQKSGPDPAFVDHVTRFVRDNLTLAHLPDGSSVSAETPEERAKPIVSRSLEEQTVDRALLTAGLTFCKLDGTAISYLPYMDRLRASRRYSDKQLAYVDLLHSTAFSFLRTRIANLPCSPEIIVDMRSHAAEDPVQTP
jgi:hypothetical protein